jgi:hypothetical protein
MSEPRTYEMRASTPEETEQVLQVADGLRMFLLMTDVPFAISLEGLLTAIANHSCGMGQEVRQVVAGKVRNVAAHIETHVCEYDGAGPETPRVAH